MPRCSSDLAAIADDEVNPLPRIPLDARGELRDRDGGLSNQLAVLPEAVGDGDAVAEIGVRLKLAAEHALDVGGGDVAAFDEQTPGGANRLFFILGARAEPYVPRVELNHVCRFAEGGRVTTRTALVLVARPPPWSIRPAAASG